MPLLYSIYSGGLTQVRLVLFHLLRGRFCYQNAGRCNHHRWSRGGRGVVGGNSALASILRNPGSSYACPA